MAFNPFNWFRKHQKVFFAGLTILCMLVFIGQFGAGDVVQRGLAIFGRGGGATVARVNGRRVNERDFELLGRKRQAADQFIQSVVFAQEGFGFRIPRALGVVGAQVKDESKPGSPLARLGEVYRRYTGRLFPPPFDARGLDQARREIRRDLAVLQDMSRDEGIKDEPERLKTLQTMAALLGLQAWMFEPGSGREFYFGGSRRPDDLLDFLAWKDQADKLGIVLTDEDVLKEVNREAGQAVLQDKDFAGDRFVKGFLAINRQGLTARELLDALRDEFRVVLAQGALVGLEPGARGYRVWLGAGKGPAFATPDEFLQYFRDKRTTLRVKLLSLPVSGFVSQVRGDPTPEELRQRYEKYRDKEPDPAKREPGFKEPRRVKVEYVSANPADDWYRAQGRKGVESLLAYSDPRTAPAFRFAAGASAACQVGVTGLPGALCLGLPAAFDPLHAEYLAHLDKNTHPWYTPEGEAFTIPEAKPNRLQLSSVLRPDNAASTFGQLLGAGAGRGSAFAAPAAFYASATFAEARDSIRFSAASLMAHATAGQQFPAVGALFTRFCLTAPFLPDVPPEKVRPQLVASLEERYAQETLKNNLKTFTTELAKLKGKPKEAAAYVRKAAKEYHFRLSSMPNARGANAIADALNRKVDIGLRPLYEAERRQSPRPLRPDEFADRFLFADRGVYQPEELGRPEEGREAFVYWRSEDLPARVRSFEEVRGEVADAWRVEKARVLARREARRLAEAVNKRDLSPADAERFLREQHPGEFFELDRVSQLVPPEKEVQPLVRTEYRPYQIPEDRKDLFPYPPEPAVKLVRDLLRDLKRPGRAAVVADRPERHFYVAVLFNRDEPSLKEFYAVYKRAGQGSDDLWDRFVEQSYEDHRRQVIEQLRREASGGKVDPQGRWDIPPDVRERYEGREGGE